MTKVIILCFLLLSLFGCRKQYSHFSSGYLEGRWEWVGSSQFSQLDLTPETEGVTYAIDFNNSDGEITYYKNNKKLKTYGMELISSVATLDKQGNITAIDFDIILNGKKRNQLWIHTYTNPTDISINQFPFDFSNNFKKVN